MNKEDLKQIRSLFKEEFEQVSDLFDKKINTQTEDLARMMQNQFAEQDKKFTDIDGKFAGIDEKFAGIDEKFAMMNAKFTDIDTKFNQQKEEIIGEVREMFKPLQDGVDFVINNFIKPDQENTANTSAHDRFNKNFYEIKEHISLDAIKAVKPL